MWNLMSCDFVVCELVQRIQIKFTIFLFYENIMFVCSKRYYWKFDVELHLLKIFVLCFNSILSRKRKKKLFFEHRKPENCRCRSGTTRHDATLLSLLRMRCQSRKKTSICHIRREEAQATVEISWKEYNCKCSNGGENKHAPAVPLGTWCDILASCGGAHALRQA
jgi:hypothetical protein